MILDLIFFVLGIALIILGANYLTDGASILARRLGLSPLMVGLTIVAFGTSAPELVVSLMSALKGSSDIALGNVVGSNIFNVLTIGGITALVAPLAVTQTTVRREIPLMLLASIVLMLMALDIELGGVPAQMNVVSRSEGWVLLGFFAIFLTYTIAISKSSDASTEEVDDISHLKRPVWLLILFIIGGLVSLVGGGQLFVDASTSIAQAMGMSEAVIGLTLVAAGTSLPELATSVAAALKGEHEIAVGNIVGSGIFNIFMILGITSSITPIKVAGIGLLDFTVLIGSALLLYLLAVFFGKRTITRLEGGILLLCYLVYTVYLVVQI